MGNMRFLSSVCLSVHVHMDLYKAVHKEQGLSINF